MKLTFNVTTEQAFILCKLIVKNLRYAYDNNYEPLSQRDKLSLMHKMRDIIPQFYPEAENDHMRSVLEKITDLLDVIDQETTNIENEEKKEE